MRNLNVLRNAMLTFLNIFLMLKNIIYSGTKEFSIALSHCGYDWSEQVKEVFSDPRGKTCQELANQQYIIGKVARYVRFLAISYYGEGPILGFFNIDYDSTIIEEDDKFPCPGSDILILYKLCLVVFNINFVVIICRNHRQTELLRQDISWCLL